MSETILLLLSKYSTECDNLVQLMKNSGVPFNFLNTIFVDNPEIRESILSKKEYNIHTVPTILVFGGNTVDKFEDGQAFEWIQKTVENLKIIEQEQLNKQIESRVNSEVSKVRQEMEQQIEMLREQQMEVEPIVEETDHQKMAISSLKDDKQMPTKVDLSKIWSEEEESTNNKMIEKSIKKSDSAKDVAERMSKEREDLFTQQKQNNP